MYLSGSLQCISQGHYSVSLRVTTVYLSGSLQCISQGHYSVSLRVTTVYLSGSLQCISQGPYSVSLRVTTVYLSGSLLCISQGHFSVSLRVTTVTRVRRCKSVQCIFSPRLSSSLDKRLRIDEFWANRQTYWPGRRNGQRVCLDEVLWCLITSGKRPEGFWVMVAAINIQIQKQCLHPQAHYTPQ